MNIERPTLDSLCLYLKRYGRFLTGAVVLLCLLSYFGYERRTAERGELNADVFTTTSNVGNGAESIAKVRKEDRASGSSGENMGDMSRTGFANEKNGDGRAEENTHDVEVAIRNGEREVRTNAARREPSKLVSDIRSVLRGYPMRDPFAAQGENAKMLVDTFDTGAAKGASIETAAVGRSEKRGVSGDSPMSSTEEKPQYNAGVTLVGIIIAGDGGAGFAVLHIDGRDCVIGVGEEVSGVSVRSVEGNGVRIVEGGSERWLEI